MEWDPTQFFRTEKPQPAPFALLVLNQPINEKAFRVLKRHGAFSIYILYIYTWSAILTTQALFTICADGGANRFYDLMKNQQDGSESTAVCI